MSAGLPGMVLVTTLTQTPTELLNRSTVGLHCAWCLWLCVCFKEALLGGKSLLVCVCTRLHVYRGHFGVSMYAVDSLSKVLC